MRYLVCAILLTGLLGAVPMAVAGQRPDDWELVLILVDLSNSSLNHEKPVFTHRAARYIRENHLENLPLGSKILIRSFATPEQRHTLLDLDYELLNRVGSRARDVLPRIESIIGRLPEIIERKKLFLGEQTWLLRTLHGLAHRLPKTKHRTTIIILSDCLEYSGDADAYKLVKTDGGRFPAPASDLLRGARVIALGAGSDCRTLEQGRRLEAMWTEWVHSAGGRLVWIPEL